MSVSLSCQSDDGLTALEKRHPIVGITMKTLFYRALIILALVLAPQVSRAQPHAEIMAEDGVQPGQAISVRYSGLDNQTAYWAVLFDPATQTGVNGDYIQYADIQRRTGVIVTFGGLSAGTYLVRLQPAIRGADALIETDLTVGIGLTESEGAEGEDDGKGPIAAAPPPVAPAPPAAPAVPVASVSETPPQDSAILTRDAYHPIGVPEDAFLDSYEGEISCESMSGTRLRLDLTDIEAGFNFPLITGQFTMTDAEGAVLVQGPMRARSASLSARRLVFVLDYDSFREAGMRDYWINDWQVYVSADLNEIESRRPGCHDITFVAVADSLAPRNDATTESGSELMAAQLLNLHTVGEACETARTRNQIGACIFQSILYEAGPGSIRNYNGSVLRILVPSGGLVPSATECRFAMTSLRRDMVALGMAFIDTRNQRLAFSNTELSCRSVGYLRNQLFGETLSLSECTPDLTSLGDFRACLDQFAQVYDPVRLAAMQTRAEQTFQEAIGMVPDVIAEGFSGDPVSQFVEALEDDAEWCRRGALNPDLLNIGNDPYGSATGGILASTAFSQLTTAEIEQRGLDWSVMQSRVSCEDVMQLLGHYTDAGEDLLADYQALSQTARDAMCASGRSEDGPSDRLLAVAINSYLVSQCTNAGFLSFWLEDAVNGQNPQGNPFALALLDFDGVNNQCRVRSRLTTHFSQPELSFRVSRASVVSQSERDDGQFAMNVNAWLSCRSNSTSPVREALDCGAFEVAPAPFSLVASWSDTTCEWSVSGVERRR